MATSQKTYTNKDDIAAEFDGDEFNTNSWADKPPSQLPDSDLITELLNQLATQLDPKHKEEEATWKPYPDGPQERAFYSKAYELFYGGSAGGGKMLVTSELIATPFGWTTHGDVKVNDQVCNPDGSVARVIAVHPHPNRDVYRITTADGGTVLAGDEHLWLYWLAGRKTKSKAKSESADEFRNLIWPAKAKVQTTLKLKEDVDKAKAALAAGERPWWPIIPQTRPVKYTRPTRTRQGDVIRINPYLLGLLIGDGTICNNNIVITTIDSEIVDEVKHIHGKHRTRWDNTKAIHLNDSAELRRELESYGLYGRKSHDKFIPTNYLYAATETRLRLMQGLIDTDGYIDDRGHVSYTTISPQLAKDVQQLAWSLGAKATMKRDKSHYKNDDGEIIECQDAYTIYMQGRDMQDFVSLPRKKERCKAFNGGTSEPGRRIVNVEYVGKMDCTCITVDHWNGLYITNDFIVTHNSDLMIGLATSELSPHRKSIMFRRTFPELKDIIGRVLDLYAKKGAVFKGNPAMRFEKLPKGKQLEFGYVQRFEDAGKYQGRPHDLKLFDELPTQPESVYKFLIGWARTAEPNVPVRIVSAGNPPMTTDGMWVVNRWGPWLDPDHPNPADPAELRWFATLDGQDTELTGRDGGDGEAFEFTNRDGKLEIIKPKSRTFIPARLTDNPALMNTDYMATLQSMDEPYRSLLLNGDFTMSMKPDQWQVIQRRWVDAAVLRWQEMEREGKIKELEDSLKNVTYGLDVAEGGNDKSCLVRMVGSVVHWIEFFSEPDMMKLSRIVYEKMWPRTAPIAVDAIGVGLGPASRLQELGAKVLPVKVSMATKGRTENGQMSFFNLRSELWWRMRERLDPDSRGVKAGKYDLMAMPKNSILIGDLTAPRYQVVGTTTGAYIRVDSQDAIKEKIGRSPDGGNALMLALRAERANVPFRMV